MSQIDVENAVIQLYEDGSLRGELTDQPAEQMLSWGAERLRRLAERHADDPDGFEEGFKLLRRLLKRINKLTWERLELDEVGLTERFGQLTELTDSLGLSLAADALGQYLLLQGAADEGGHVQLVTDLLDHPTLPVTTEHLPAVPPLDVISTDQSEGFEADDSEE